MADLKNYDPLKIIVVLGEIQFQGFAEGTFVTTEQETDTFTKSVGAGGDVTRVRNHNNSGRMTVTLIQTSPTNDLLSARFNVDKATGLNTAPLMIKDLNGTTLLEAPNAWIVKRAEVEYGSEASNREWMIDYDQLLGINGGALV